MRRFVSYLLFVLGSASLLLAQCSRDTTPDAISPDEATYSPTPFRPQAVGERLVGPIVYTVDARSKELWMYFDFSRGSVVSITDPKTDDWDLAFQRHAIRSNGGATNPAGQAAIAGIETTDFASLRQVPATAEFHRDVRTKRRLHPYNPAVYKWYNYSYTANILTPKPLVYIVRTQDGKYAKMRILSYYCKGNIAGCMTFEYVYQGDGSTNLAASARQASQ
jgi:hypothetical protein